MSRRRHGVTLVEVLVAAVLLGLLAAGVLRGLSLSGRTLRLEREQAIALMLAKNETERWAAAGGRGWTVGADTARTNEAGEPAPQGRYVRIATRTAECLAADGTGDNTEIPPTACGTDRLVWTLHVEILYPRPDTLLPVGHQVMESVISGTRPGAGTVATAVTALHPLVP